MFRNPQSKLLPQAKASIVSNGRLIFEILGTKSKLSSEKIEKLEVNYFFYSHYTKLIQFIRLLTRLISNIYSPNSKNVKKKTIKKKYIPNSQRKYMCAKHKKFLTEELINWKKDIKKANNLGNLLNSSDDNVSSADIVDQASSYTDKSVEMKALNRSRKLISKLILLYKD